MLWECRYAANVKRRRSRRTFTSLNGRTVKAALERQRLLVGIAGSTRSENTTELEVEPMFTENEFVSTHKPKAERMLAVGLIVNGGGAIRTNSRRVMPSLGRL